MAQPPTITLDALECDAATLDVKQAAATYREHGCLIVRGLLQSHVEVIGRDIDAAARQAIGLLEQARKVPEGWVTPDGTLFLPAPEGHTRDKQIMVLACTYRTSGAFFQSAFDTPMLNLIEAILGPDIELFLDGQCLYKEPAGGHPKLLHQDAAYFEHKHEGPVGVLTYVVDTDLNNGALHVIPGSHQLGVLEHVDTFSHLGLDTERWTFEQALPICGGPGDAIFFNVKLIHGSKPNWSIRPRPVFIHRYRRADDYAVVRATTTDNRNEAESNRYTASKENQLGLMVRGWRVFDPNR